MLSCKVVNKTSYCKIKKYCKIVKINYKNINDDLKRFVIETGRICSPFKAVSLWNFETFKLNGVEEPTVPVSNSSLLKYNASSKVKGCDELKELRDASRPENFNENTRDELIINKNILHERNFRLFFCIHLLVSKIYKIFPRIKE